MTRRNIVSERRRRGTANKTQCTLAPVVTIFVYTELDELTQNIDFDTMKLDLAS